ncbi:homoserine O-acetyltransferase MetX [Brachybacterium huguangmaarense]
MTALAARPLPPETTTPPRSSAAPIPAPRIPTPRIPAPASAASALPATGAWRPGDPAAERCFAEIGDLPLESGAVLPDVRIAYETWGELAHDGSNAVLVLHALTGDAHVRGPAGPGQPSAGWWEDLVGPGRPIDTDRWFVVAPNVLGGCQGTTGPASDSPDGSPWAARFPALTPRDQVAAEAALMDALGIGRWALVVGASMGGMRALEWGVSRPDAVERLAVIASCAVASADQIAWNSAQAAAIRACEGFAGGDYYDAPPGLGPHEGLGVARRIAHITYRTAGELEDRFANRLQDDGASARDGIHQVASYLDHHADKLARRFDANTYLVLLRSMDVHDVGRDRGGVTEALARVRARTLVIAVDTDRLFPTSMSRTIADGIDGARFVEIHSPVGHDGFLVRSPALEQGVRSLLETPAG